MDSNYTLRFPRTAREAGIYGPLDNGTADFWDKLIAWLICMGLCFVIGVAVGIGMAA